MLRNVFFAAATVLIAMTALVRAMDTGDLAARAGFLIAAAHYCGVSPMRTSYVRQWIGTQLVAVPNLVRPFIDSTISSMRSARQNRSRVRRRDGP